MIIRISVDRMRTGNTIDAPIEALITHRKTVTVIATDQKIVPTAARQEPTTCLVIDRRFTITIDFLPV